MTTWNQRLPFRIARGVGRAFFGNVGALRYYAGDMSERRDDFGEPGGDAVLLIQGFFQTRRVMASLEERLRADGFRVVSFNLGGLLGLNTRSIPTIARMIDGKMGRLLERTSGRPVHVIGHSMGGLVGRYLVQSAGGDRYARTVITLGTPHHGTPTAALGGALGLLLLSRGLWQLFPISPLVKELRSGRFPAGVRLVSVYSKHDVICPWQTSVLTPRDGEDVRNVMVKGLGHMDLVEDPYVYGMILRELKDHPYDTSGGPVASLDEEVTRLGPQR
ncbi:MAG: alpha/beta fold hydrolase [Deltaproteobacteria bacterium]|nr:alpha/beta fold hydrolase [Deltaproteobacteria bacterium]